MSQSAEDSEHRQRKVKGKGTYLTRSCTEVSIFEGIFKDMVSEACSLGNNAQASGVI